MRWVTPLPGRTYFVLDTGRIVVELMHNSDESILIIDAAAGSPEFKLRLKGARFIDLKSAKEFVEREWTIDGDGEASTGDDDEDGQEAAAREGYRFP